MTFLLTALALLLELAFGYPQGLFARIGHPVTWIGRLIGALDRHWNRPADPAGRRRALGVLALLVIVLVAGGAGAAVAGVAGRIAGPAGVVLAVLAGSALLAQRSLAAHVRAVAAALETGGIVAGRAAVSRIVGRDPEALDVAGVSRAAIESLAENFSDGIVAPAVWMLAGGLPGAAVYKAVNTADSMIGHKTARHGAFGWAAARFDDLINLPASRLAGLLIVAAAALMPGASPAAAWRAIRRDARFHRSPNAGWPEAAMAGALGFAIAGPRSYGGVMVSGPEMGAGGRRELGAADIRQALRLFWLADGLMVALIAAGAAIALVL
ncbi:adenosylcobinamide-phosphate synthase CbiB [Pseudoxanthobacter sp.]|uniref:adenosylcobinamide-phosphate synthase CbiB n=1 Tax=Pseudoxanthobacter sp. TaxID=1925742 RepID=UPI002FE0CF75